VAANVRERLPVSKEEAQEDDMERFHLKKISDWEVRTEQHIKISNMIADMENLPDSEGVKRA
jgi:hypothetical protein